MTSKISDQNKILLEIVAGQDSSIEALSSRTETNAKDINQLLVFVNDFAKKHQDLQKKCEDLQNSLRLQNEPAHRTLRCPDNCPRIHKLTASSSKQNVFETISRVFWNILWDRNPRIEVDMRNASFFDKTWIAPGDSSRNQRRYSISPPPFASWWTKMSSNNQSQFSPFLRRKCEYDQIRMLTFLLETDFTHARWHVHLNGFLNESYEASPERLLDMRRRVLSDKQALAESRRAAELILSARQGVCQRFEGYLWLSLQVLVGTHHYSPKVRLHQHLSRFYPELAEAVKFLKPEWIDLQALIVMYWVVFETYFMCGMESACSVDYHPLHRAAAMTAFDLAEQSLNKLLLLIDQAAASSLDSSNAVQNFDVSLAYIPNQPGVGIENGGDTCFMNAAMQVIQNDALLRQAIASSIPPPSNREIHLFQMGLYLDSNAQAPLPPGGSFNSLIHLFSTSEYRLQRLAFLQFVEDNPNNAPAALFCQKIRAAMEARRQNQPIADLSEKELQICAPLLQTILATANLRNTIIDGTRPTSALNAYRPVHQAYELSRNTQQAVLPDHLTLRSFRGFMPGGERNGQQDADVFLGRLMRFVDPAQYPQFFHRSIIRKRYIEVPAGELTDGQKRALAAKTREVELAKAADSNYRIADHFALFVPNEMVEEAQTQWEIALKLPDVEAVAADQPPASGQDIFHAHFAPMDVIGDELVIRRKDNDTLAYFRTDRQQVIFPEADDQHAQQRLTIRLNRFYTVRTDQIDQDGRPIFESRRQGVRVQMPDELEINGVSYEKCAVICHSGNSAQAGHYTALVKGGKLVGDQPQWWCFDDAVVSALTPAQKNSYINYQDPITRTDEDRGYVYHYRRKAAEPAAIEVVVDAVDNDS